MSKSTRPPTCKILFNEEFGDPIQTIDDASWRHGVYRTEVFHRQSDNTFWQAKYRVSTDGETHGLRDNEAVIVQVLPQEITAVIYLPEPKC